MWYFLNCCSSCHTLCRAVDPDVLHHLEPQRLFLVEIWVANSLLPKSRLVVMCVLPTYSIFLNNFSFYDNVIINSIKPLLPVTEKFTNSLTQFTHTFIHSYTVGTTNGMPTPTQYSDVEDCTDAPVASRLVFTVPFRGHFVSSGSYINLSSFSIHQTALGVISVTQPIADVHLCYWSCADMTDSICPEFINSWRVNKSTYAQSSSVLEKLSHTSFSTGAFPLFGLFLFGK